MDGTRINSVLNSRKLEFVFTMVLGWGGDCNIGFINVGNIGNNGFINVAVNNVVIIPIPKVIAKPFTGPDPKANNIAAAINVVILASNTVIFAFE